MNTPLPSCPGEGPRASVAAPQWRGELYLPATHGARVPAIVIMSSSAGVCDIRERFYARFFSGQGVAALVVDSFSPRGVSNTIADQSLVRNESLEADAYEAFAVLARNRRIDAGRIGILGVSKGGLIALHTSLSVRRQWFRRPQADFAAHMALVPPAHMQHRDARTTGRPVLILLAGRDDYTGTGAPLEYADRMRRAGNPDILTKVYPEASHAWELTGPPVFLENAENYSDCSLLVENDASLTDTRSRRRMTMDVFFRDRAQYMRLGAHAGGGTEELKRETASGLVRFFRACA